MVRWSPLIILLSLTIAPTTRAMDERQPPVKTVVEKNFDAQGVHWRIMTPKGIVHVWRPDDIIPATAGIVIYVHGYYDNADDSWGQYFLGEQFWHSRQNAVFIVPEAPIDDGDEVQWENLDQLIAAVFGRIKLRQPTGPMVVVGHSGAFRTIVCWLSNKRLSEVILLDALYAKEKEFGAWIGATGFRNRRMVLVGVETAVNSRLFSRQFGFSVFRVGLPHDYAKFAKAEKNARLLHITTNYDHMELVHTGEVIPVVLHLSPLLRLPDRKPAPPLPQLAIGATP